MIIISENELIHTDSFSDVIEHHGVKGMKWGQRMKRWGAAAGRAAVNGLRHPILADQAISDKYSQDAFFSKRRKAEGENRRDYGERQRAARQKMTAEYKGLKNQYKKDVMDAKTKRGQKRVLAGGRY